MPTAHKIYQDLIEKPQQMVLDEVKLEGLTKLKAEMYSTGRMFVSPDLEKMSQEEKDAEMEEWNRTHKGIYPTDREISTVWMAQKLVTEDGKSPLIRQAYSPIRFLLPTAKKETYRELKERIERESMRAVEDAREPYMGGQVNAFYVGNLRTDFVLSGSTQQAIPMIGDDFMNDIARDVFIPRMTFDLCLFDINPES